MATDLKFSTFNCLIPHFNALARVGYYKIVHKPLSCGRRCLHNGYRFIICFFVILYNIQHLIRAVQVRHSSEQLVDTLFILLTILNALGKQAAFNLRSHRIDGVIDTINGIYFAARRPYHVTVLKKNAALMARILTIYHVAALTCSNLWLIYPIVNRVRGKEVPFTGYIPFDTAETVSFSVALAYMNVLITCQAYANVTMDCTIVAFYSQGQTQIQILRHDLEKLTEGVKANLVTRSNKFPHNDHNQNQMDLLQRRLKNCITHHKEILRFIKEVESIFGEAMVIQFFVMSWVICMTVYKIVELNIASVEFFSITCYLVCMLAQLFIYCYYGTQLTFESELINQSIYDSGWLTLPPEFRRQLLIMMQFCSRPVAPLIAYVIPMSLETYIAVLKSSYSLFTFLKR